MYLWLKLIHLVAMVVFLGNMYTGFFWKAHADRTRDPRLIRHTIDGIIISDRWLTLPGVALLIGVGVLMAIQASLPLLRIPWIAASFVLLTISGLAYVFRLVPLHRALRDVADRAVAGAAMDWDAYRRLSRRWTIWALISLGTPLVGMALMVLKPQRLF